MTVSLSDVVVAADQLLLDPNNPRFADLGVSKTIPESKVAEPSVQQTAQARMLDERFEVDLLKESIEKMGFLHVDRMVVIELPEAKKHLVVEGNRRLASIKALLDEVDAGEVDLPPAVAESLTQIPVLLIGGGTPEEREEYARNLQGIRHIAGVKPWGPFQQAQAVGRMLDEGMSVSTIKSALGLSTQRVNLLRSVYLGINQMRDDPDFTDAVKPELFSNFVEALKSPAIREWVGWDKEKGVMTDDAARHQFYRLVVGMEDEEGQIQSPKVIDAKDFRLLPKVMEDGDYFEDFLANPALSLQDAYKAVGPAPKSPDWKSLLKRDLATLGTVPHAAVADASDEEVKLLERLRDTCAKFLKDIALVQKG